MADPRDRLRPLLHSGAPVKVKAALDEILARNDPALHDWVLQAVYITELASSDYWRWRYDDTEGFLHPSLEPDAVLRLVAHGSSDLAAELRGMVQRLGIQPGAGRQHDPALDISPIGRMNQVTKLRILAVDPLNQYEWRAILAAGAPRPLRGFSAIAGMTALEHLTVLAGASVDLAPLANLAKLRHVELIACDTADLTPLASTAIETLIVIGCKQVTAIDALPPTLRRLQVEDLPALTSIAGVERAPKLESLEVTGVPLPALPALPPSVQVTFEQERTPRRSF